MWKEDGMGEGEKEGRWLVAEGEEGGEGRGSNVGEGRGNGRREGDGRWWEGGGVEGEIDKRGVEGRAMVG